MADEDVRGGLEGGVGKKSSGKSGPSAILLFLGVLNTVAMLAVAYMQFQFHQEHAGSVDIKDVVAADMAPKRENSLMGKVKKNDGIMLPLEGFTANLAQGDGVRRFISVNLVLKFSMDSKEDEFRARKPQIRDAIISTLNSKRPEDVLKLEGKKYLKEEIKAAINSFLVDGRVVDVFYVGFQVN